MPVFAPSSIQEAWDLVFHAFDVTDKYRTPVMILAEGILGQMMEPLEMRTTSPFIADKSWCADGNANRPERNKISSINLDPVALDQMNRDRFALYDQIKKNEVMVENGVKDGDTVAIVAYGTPSRIALNAIEELAADGIKAGLIRPITLWPFPCDVFQNLPPSVKHILVVELSMGQMIEDVRLSVAGKYPVHFYGRCGGLIFEPSEIAGNVREIIKGAH